MPGTLLVHDAAFPRSGGIVATPSVSEVVPPEYPGPCRTLPIPDSYLGSDIFGAILRAAESMGPLDRLILFGHGMVRGGVFVGIQMGVHGLVDTSVLGPSLFQRLHFSTEARIELWVCEAASTSTGAGSTASGESFCRQIAAWAHVPVRAGRQTQYFDTVSTEFLDSTDGSPAYRTVVRFLPWDGPVETFSP